MKIATLLVAGMAFTMAILHFADILKADNFVQGLLWIILGVNNVRDYKNADQKESLLDESNRK